MALLIFSPADLTPPLKALLEPELRKTVANRVNETILSGQGMRRDAMIRKLVKLRLWSEKKAREAKKDLPSHLSVGLDPPEKSQNGSSEDNGDGEPMAT